MDVTIWHNVQQDPGGRPTGMMDGYRDGDRMAAVFAFSVPTCEPGQVLEEVFQEFNVGEGLLAKAYRRHGLRSLSVGDVVAIQPDDLGEPVRFHCARFGWTLLPAGHQLAGAK